MRATGDRKQEKSSSREETCWLSFHESRIFIIGLVQRCILKPFFSAVVDIPFEAHKVLSLPLLSIIPTSLTTFVRRIGVLISMKRS